jgi:hypothetical protein
MSISLFSKPVFTVWILGIILILTACQTGMVGALDNPMPSHTQSTRTATDLPPSPMIASTLTATIFVPTQTPSPSATPMPTATPIATATPTTRGALNWEQETRLYEASMRFLADSEEQAIVIVRNQIDYLESIAEHPSLVCGPLSAVILRDAGLLPSDVDLHGFWLLDPRLRPSQIVLETYFPPERYEWYHFENSTTEFDFNAFPLLPGDFIYLYAGINGTFEHIITVTRVDQDGRAYTVSNLATEQGFVIRELMLYDPSDPGVGQFYDWMNRDINYWLGMTGDGGFDLWRPTAPVQDYE